MRTYYGTKRIEAEPANRHVQGGGADGYAVRYPDGYESWSPKDAFEAAYKPDGAMDFGGALCALKEGRCVARSGWNGKGMWLIKTTVIAAIAHGAENPDMNPDIVECIVMKTADNKLVPWLCSITDMMAEDWGTVE